MNDYDKRMLKALVEQIADINNGCKCKECSQEVAWVLKAFFDRAQGRKIDENEVIDFDDLEAAH